MLIETSLAEILMNAISQGRVHGIQFKRGTVDEKKTFNDLKLVIGDKLDGACRVAREGAIAQLHREYAPFKWRGLLTEVEAQVADPALKARIGKALRGE